MYWERVGLFSSSIKCALHQNKWEQRGGKEKGSHRPFEQENDTVHLGSNTLLRNGCDDSVGVGDFNLIVPRTDEPSLVFLGSVVLIRSSEERSSWEFGLPFETVRKSVVANPHGMVGLFAFFLCLKTKVISYCFHPYKTKGTVRASRHSFSSTKWTKTLFLPSPQLFLYFVFICLSFSSQCTI